MGALVSSMLGTDPDQTIVPPPPKVVLVPPFFQRDVRSLSRFCRSSYDYLGNRKQLARLLRDYLSPELRGMVLLSPPDDPRVSVRAKMRPSGGSMVLRWQPSSAASLHTFIEMAASLDSPGDVSLRGSYLHPGSGLGAFVVAPLARDLSGESAQVGVRYSSAHATAGTIFVPRRGELDKFWMAARLHGFTLGLQLSPSLPVRQALASALAIRRPLSLISTPRELVKTANGSSSSSTGGCPDVALPLCHLGNGGGGINSLDELRSWFRSHGSVLLAYSPPPRPGAAGAPFTASVELKQGGSLTFSFFQHVAATRQVVNPFEEDEVVGITNYLDIGLQLTTAAGPTAGDFASDTPNHIKHRCTPTATATIKTSSSTSVTARPTGAASSGEVSQSAGSSRHVKDVAPAESSKSTGDVPASINLAVSWQMNKNWLLKARVGNQSAAAAVGARVWHAVSAYLTASVSVDYAHLSHPRYGVELCVENFGPLRYERGVDDVAAGRALLQRHEASEQDLNNFAGHGVLIRRSASASGSRVGASGVTESERRKVAELM